MEPIKNYFNAEKYESVLFIITGLIAIAFSLYFIMISKSAFYTGMAIPLISVALIQIMVGTIVFVRSPKDIKRVERFMEFERKKILTEEIPRMDDVMRNFRIYRYVEISLFIVGILMILLFYNYDMIFGTGIGLCIQAGLMLSLDFFAEKRGAEYLNYLIALS